MKTAAMFPWRRFLMNWGEEFRAPARVPFSAAKKEPKRCRGGHGEDYDSAYASSRSPMMALPRTPFTQGYGKVLIFDWFIFDIYIRNQDRFYSLRRALGPHFGIKTSFAIQIETNPNFTTQVGRNARVQKYNGSARNFHIPKNQKFKGFLPKFFIMGVWGVSIMGDLDEAQRSRSPPRGHPRRVLVTLARAKVTRPVGRNPNLSVRLSYWQCPFSFLAYPYKLW